MAVPLELKGLEVAWKEYGSGNISWKTLVYPASKLARSGFAAHPYLNLMMRQEWVHQRLLQVHTTSASMGVNKKLESTLA